MYRARLSGPSGFAKTLALKLVHRNLTEGDAAFRQALVTEARIGGLLKHPHIVDVYDFGEAEGQHFVAMEWIDGVDGHALLERSDPLTPGRRWMWASPWRRRCTTCTPWTATTDRWAWCTAI